MMKIEPLLLDTMLQLSDMNAPMPCREGLELARSLVKDAAKMNEIRSWKEKHLHQDDESDKNDKDEIIRKAWLSGFCQCYKNDLSAKRLFRLTASMMTGA